MAYQQKDMEGSLFKNDKREKDSHPHMQGSCTIDGVKYWISAWTNGWEGGKDRWQGLKFKRADGKPDTRGEPQQKRQPGKFDDMPDDIPA